MSEYRRNFLVGVFMLGGLGTAATLMVLFGEKPAWLGGAEYSLKITVDKLSGVTEGTPINMNGVEIGRVTGLEFKNPKAPHEGVDIVVRVKNRYDVPKGTSARIFVSPIGLGRSRIELELPLLPPGKEIDILPHAETAEAAVQITGQMASMLGDILPPTFLPTFETSGKQIGNLAEALTPVARDLHDIFEKRTMVDVDDPTAAAKRLTATLYTVIERFDATLKHWNEVMGDPAVKSGLRQAVVNIQDMSQDGKATFASLRRTSDKLETDVKRVSDELLTTVQDARSQINKVGPLLDSSAQLATNLNRVAQSLTEGDGTAARLLRDARLYESLLISVERITDMIDTLRRLAAKFERQGYVEFKYYSAVGPVKGTRPIPEP